MRVSIAAKMWLLLAALTAVTALPALAATYYVDSAAGDDRAAGDSPQSAWRTLKRVRRARLLPGDRLLFRRGGRWHGGIDLSLTGKEGSPIVLGAYGAGPEPLFEGGQRFDWEDLGGSLYRLVLKDAEHVPGLLTYRGQARPRITVLRLPGASSLAGAGAVLLQLEGGYRSFSVKHVEGDLVSGITFFKLAPKVAMHVRELQEGREVQKEKTLPAPVMLYDPAGLVENGDWLWDPQQNAVLLRSSVPPEQADVLVARVRWGLRLVRSRYVVVEDLVFRNMSEVGALVQDSRYVTLRKLRIEGVGSSGHKSGILLFNSSYCRVLENQVSDVMGNGIAVFGFGPGEDSPRRSWNNLIAGNRVARAGSAGISLASDFPPQAVLVKNNLVRKNVVVEANRYAYDAAGIYTLFIGAGNAIDGNTVKNGGSPRLRSAGIMLDVGTAPTRVEGNLLQNNSNGGVVITGPGHRVEDNDLINNCAPSWPCAQVVFFPVRANGGGLVRRNRVEAGTRQGLVLYTANPRFDKAALVLDYNRYLSANPRPFCWSDTWSCDNWVDFETWRSRGLDAHSSYSRGP